MEVVNDSCVLRQMLRRFAHLNPYGLRIFAKRYTNNKLTEPGKLKNKIYQDILNILNSFTSLF